MSSDFDDKLGSLLKHLDSPAHSAEFTASVMQQIEAEESWFAGNFSEILQTWLFPAVQFACALLLLVFSQQSNTVQVDVEMVLLAGLGGEVAQSDYSSRSFDLSMVMGIDVEGY